MIKHSEDRNAEQNILSALAHLGYFSSVRALDKNNIAYF